MLRLYILTQLHRINIGICMKTITYRNRTHACICSDAWHTCVVGVTCHQQHVRKDEGKLWYWRHPLGFKLNDPASPVQPFRTCTRLFVLFFFFILISFPSFLPPFSLVSPFFAFYSGENFPRRNVSITNRFAPMMFSFLTRVYMIHMFERTIWNSICDSSSVASNSRVHMWNESGRHPWLCIRHSHRSLCFLSIFFISWKFNHLLCQLYHSRFTSIFSIPPMPPHRRVASSFVRTHVCFTRDCFKTRNIVYDDIIKQIYLFGSLMYNCSYNLMGASAVLRAINQIL